MPIRMYSAHSFLNIKMSEPQIATKNESNKPDGFYAGFFTKLAFIYYRRAELLFCPMFLLSLLVLSCFSQRIHYLLNFDFDTLSNIVSYLIMKVSIQLLYLQADRVKLNKQIILYRPSEYNFHQLAQQTKFVELRDKNHHRKQAKAFDPTESYRWLPYNSKSLHCLGNCLAGPG